MKITFYHSQEKVWHNTVIYGSEAGTVIKENLGGSWLAQLKKNVTLDLRYMSISPHRV